MIFSKRAVPSHLATTFHVESLTLLFLAFPSSGQISVVEGTPGSMLAETVRVTAVCSRLSMRAGGDEKSRISLCDGLRRQIPEKSRSDWAFALRTITE